MGELLRECNLYIAVLFSVWHSVGKYSVEELRIFYESRAFPIELLI